jgi:RND family efflux transporter MFP subunit
MIRTLPRRAFPSLLVVVALLGSGCGRGHGDHAHGPGGEHAAEEEEPIVEQVTVATEKTEIFLEHRVCIVGKPVKFVTHVSDMRTGDPRREGPVTFTLRQGSQTPIRHTEPKPARAGIYLPEVTFPATGAWDVSIEVPWDGGADTVALKPFHVHADDAAAKAAERPESPEGISFLKEQQWKIRARTATAKSEHLVDRVRLAAQVLVRDGGRATAAAPGAGVLEPPATGELPAVGAAVKRGDLLATVRPLVNDLGVRVAAARSATSRANVAVENAQVQVDRLRRLVAEKARTPRELEDAELVLKSARADLDAATSTETALRAAHSRFFAAGGRRAAPPVGLRAPHAVHSALGQPVAEGAGLFDLLDATTVHVHVRVPETDLPRVRNVTGGLVEMPGAPGEFAPLTGEGAGRLLRTGIEVDPATRTVPLVYEVRNADARLKLGMSLTVHLETARATDAVTLPLSAIVEEESGPVVFALLGGEAFERRPVRLGIRDGDRVEVKEGVAEGERIVSHGAYAVRLASVATAIPAHGHAH